MTAAEKAAALARCDREIEAMLTQPEGRPAYLTTLGITDWQRERAVIESEANG